jgi:hypothetical protein
LFQITNLFFLPAFLQLLPDTPYWSASSVQFLKNLVDLGLLFGSFTPLLIGILDEDAFTES